MYRWDMERNRKRACNNCKENFGYIVSIFYDILEYLVIFCSLLTAYVSIYIRRNSWNNPTFGMNFVESLNEGTYVTNVIVPAIQVTLKNLPLGKTTFVSSSKRQSSASADRKGDE